MPVTSDRDKGWIASTTSGSTITTLRTHEKLDPTIVRDLSLENGFSNAEIYHPISFAGIRLQENLAATDA